MPDDILSQQHFQLLRLRSAFEPDQGVSESEASHQSASYNHCQGLEAHAPVSEVGPSIHCGMSLYCHDTDVFR